ncbi:MAG: tetratricopeptide repeat protein, partial [Pedobacter sp.]
MKLQTKKLLLPTFAVGVISITCLLTMPHSVFGDDKVTPKRQLRPSNKSAKKNMPSKAIKPIPLSFYGGTHLQYSAADQAAMNAASQRANSTSRKARELLDNGNLAAAKAEALKSLKASPTVNGISLAVRPNMLLGEIALLQGNNEEALRYFTSLRKNSMVDGLDWNIAVCYVRLGNYTEAKRYYSEDGFLKMATNLTRNDLPGTRTPRQLEASILAALAAEAATVGQNEKALRYLDAAAQVAPNNAWILHSWGMTFMRLKQVAQAHAAFQQVVKLGKSKYLD